MRWTFILVMTFVCVSTAQEPSPRTPPPPGADISARDGDRIIIDDDARVHVVRRRQATIRTIFSQNERLLIVLVDFSKPGEFPDGQVDWAYNFYDVEGAWPLGPRWEGLTAMLQYEGDASRPRGLAFEAPQGLVQIIARGQQGVTPDARAQTVLSHRGSSNGPRRGVSFAEAETIQLNDFVRSKASGATVSTAMPPADSGVSGRGTGSATATMSVGVVRGGARGPNTAPPTIRDVASNYPVPPPPVKPRTPPPPGQEIPASDGDRIIVDDDARVQIVRRRQATVRTIFDREQRLLIVLADYAKPGQFPDGDVDSTFNFYDVEGEWPLAPRWEALTTMLHYEGDMQFPTGYALATPLGLVHLSPGGARPGVPDPGAIAVLWFRGSSIGTGFRSVSFAEAEKRQLSEASREQSIRGTTVAPR